MKFLIPFLLISLTACQSTQKTAPNIVTFAEFQKVLSPRGAIIPLPGGNESLVPMVLPGDKYPRIYTLNHDTKEFKLRYDAGQAINGLVRDRIEKNYYFHKDKAGDENAQIYKFDPETNVATKIFGNEGRKATIIDFSFDGQHIYISSNHESKDAYRIYDLNLSTGQATTLTDAKNSFQGGLADPQGKYLVLANPLGNNEQHVYLLNLSTKAMRKILAKKSTKYMPAFFDPAGKSLYLNSDDGRDRVGCATVNLDNPTKLSWVKTSSTKDIECYYKDKGNITAVVSTFDGRIKVELFTGLFGEPIAVAFPEKALVTAISVIPGTTQAVARVMTSDSPGNYFQFDIAPGGESSLKQISELNLSSIKNFAKSYDITYPSFDGKKIHGIIYAKGEWVEKGEKRPAILWPHGGPDGQELHFFHPFFQYWTQKGFVVFAPNFRGSVGYGKKFETLNDRDWGGGHIKDLVYGKRALAKLNYIDANNIFIVGASFGGFSTLSTITQYPKEFKGAVAMVALANLFTFMKSIPPDPAWQGEFLTEVGDPVKDKAFYTERSPFFHAAKISIPLKIYQAENDVRTVKAEMDSFVGELKKFQVPVEYEVLKDEGHSIARTENWEKILQGTVDFLSKQF